MIRTILAIVASLACVTAARAGTPAWMMQLELRGQTIEGQPLVWSHDQVILLGRDGVLWTFAPGEAANFRRTADRFRGLSQSELRGRLLREFGRGFEVSGTGHYLVVHPAGQRDQWAPRFEQLYRSFVHYFTARGARLDEVRVPLVAVVFSSREEYGRYAAQNQAQLLSDSIGYYCPISNRVLLYDAAADIPGADWHVNAQTIIHEAVHQCAFNTGLHTRYNMPPRWLVEGLGTMFEARGVWDSARSRSQADRVHAEQLAVLRGYVAAGRAAGSLAEFVSSDRPFHRNAEAAYAEAWGLSFFLAETQPRQYLDYLKLTAGGSPPAANDAHRLQEFQRIFGQNLAVLEAQYLRFIEKL